MTRNLATLITLLACFSFTAAAQSPRTLVSLDQNWQFHSGPLPPSSAPVGNSNDWDSITIPHIFPYALHDGHKSIYRGEAWYRKSFDAPTDWQGKRVFLRFDAVAIVSDTYLNGTRLGQHRGGFAAFTYEITSALHFGQLNQLSLRVDNRMNPDVSPQELSLLYGGIYRHVSLIVTGPINITPMDFSSPGVFLTPSAVTADQATVQVRTEIDSNKTTPQSLSVRLLLLDAGGHPLYKASASESAGPETVTPVTQTITIPHPHLWNGVADPYLYSVRVDILDHDKIIDSITQPLGLRSFRVDPKRGFILNGVPRPIHGVCLHQDWGNLGWAIGLDQEKQDLDILRQMGVDGLRLVHYQHSQSALDLYDRTGMLVWSELAQFGTVTDSDDYRQNVRQQLTEMIRQNYNHPSIVMWSLFNELNSKTRAISTPIVENLNLLAHTEDSTRPTVGAASGDTIANDHQMVAALDLIADNNYPGWYFGAPQDMNGEIEKWNSAYRSRCLAISEYGAGAKISDHAQNLKTGDVPPYGPFQPEEWQALVHEGNYAAIKSHSAVWGGFIWLAFDTGGIPNENGTFDGGNIKGLVTQDRKTRKDAYFFYQANWTEKPMLYLTSRRDTLRNTQQTPIKAYSNAAHVTLTVNGKSYGTLKPDSLHIARWKSVDLAPGLNQIQLSAPNGLHDEAVWSFTPSDPNH